MAETHHHLHLNDPLSFHPPARMTCVKPGRRQRHPVISQSISRSISRCSRSGSLLPGFLLLLVILCCPLLAQSGYCPHPAVPLYAQVTVSGLPLLSASTSSSQHHPDVSHASIRHGSLATYACDEGYELFGTPVRTCISDGTWTGDIPYCAVNVAYGKPTNQSSTVRGGDARNGNDGDTTIIHENKYCTETKNEPSPWWMVDLLQPYDIKVIRILTRGCCGHSPLHDLEIRVGNSSSVSGNRLCAWFPGTLDDGTSKDLPCAHAIKGRFVFIQMVGVEASLSLCEVFVFTTKEFSPDRCGSRSDQQQQLISFNQSCYEFQTNTGGSFGDATDYCKSHGGLMVNSVDNVTHNFLFYELERLKSKLKSKLVWLGAKRELSTNHPSFHRSRSNIWRWVNGDVVREFLWAEDQPNNYNGQQNCIVLDGGRKWQWNDVTCDLDYLPWICQYAPSNCGSPDKNENTTIVEKDFRVGQVIRYECPVGHMVDGDESRTCLPDGFWSGSAPTCRYVNCGSLNDIPRGRVILLNDSRTSFNATAKNICEKDYTLVGNETRTCLGNGSWSGEAPKCMYSWCPELPIIQHAFINITNRTVSGQAVYSCARGHKLQGNATRTCELGGKWSGDEPVCRFIDCGIPLDIRNGRYQLLNSSSTYQSIVKYYCHENYSLIGNETRNCSEHATWTGFEPTCKLIDCGKPEIPDGAELSTTNDHKFTVGSEIRIKCKAGHKRMNGSEKIKCSTSGKWDSQFPECKFIDCGRVPVILKAEVKYINSSTHLDSLVNYTCSYGFKVSGVKIRTCRDDGKWSDSSPKCEEIRCLPPEVPKNSSVVYSGNDRSTSDSFKVGSTVQYRCATGHIVRGQSLRTCEPDGSWSGSPPECKYIDCGWPYVIGNGRWLLTTNTTHYGSTVEYECVNNYRINGPPRRLCLENATWSNYAPVCEVINCGKPTSKDDKTIIDGASFFVGDKVHYSCQYGYELVGEEDRTCNPDGLWSNDLPYCRIVDCGRPPVLPNGRGYLLNSTTTYDSVIEYHCMSEFKIIGDPVRRCLATGSWSGNLPRCLEISMINEMSENDIDSRADRASVNGDRSTIHQLESSKAIGIGIAIGIGALLVLIMTIAVVCLKTKKPQPVKNTENVEVNPARLQDKDTATVMSYSRLSLESEAAAAAAAANHHNGSIRHHPNGLVTFSPQNGIGSNGTGNGAIAGHNLHHNHNHHQSINKNVNNHVNHSHHQNHHNHHHGNSNGSNGVAAPAGVSMNGQTNNGHSNQMQALHVHNQALVQQMQQSSQHNSLINNNNSGYQRPLIQGSNGTAAATGAAAASGGTTVSGSTINVAIRSGNHHNGTASPSSMSPRFVHHNNSNTSSSSNGPNSSSAGQVMTNGRSIMSTTTTTLEV